MWAQQVPRAPESYILPLFVHGWWPDQGYCVGCCNLAGCLHELHWQTGLAFSCNKSKQSTQIRAGEAFMSNVNKLETWPSTSVSSRRMPAHPCTPWGCESSLSNEWKQFKSRLVSLRHYIKIIIRYICTITFDGDSVVLHGGQDLVQFLLTGHILHLAQMKLLKFHRNIPCLEGRREGH